MTKMPHDPRDEKCTVNQWQKHKWARSFKDTISKAHYVQILRCRYCARFVCVEFKRVVLPSGRVIVEERAFETTRPNAPDATTDTLRDAGGPDGAMKAVEVQGQLAHTSNGLLHT